MPDAERTSRLSHAVAIQSTAARVESQGPFNATLVGGAKPNHALHALLFVFTCGFWGIVWLIIALTTKEIRMSMMVDEYGRIYTANAGQQWRHNPHLER
jgi:hypothetical protein